MILNVPWAAGRPHGEAQVLGQMAQGPVPAPPGALWIWARDSHLMNWFLDLEHVIMTFLKPFKIQCLVHCQYYINMADTKICILMTLSCLQRKQSGACMQSLCGAENKTGGWWKSKVRLTSQAKLSGNWCWRLAWSEGAPWAEQEEFEDLLSSVVWSGDPVSGHVPAFCCVPTHWLPLLAGWSCSLITLAT